jgi:CMP/dCMP kinase
MSFVVTIDGPSAAGKSTTARAVAERLGFLYVDTGALYRALAYKLRDLGVPPEDGAAIEHALATTRLDLGAAAGRAQVWLDGREVGTEIRTPAVSELASRLAAMPAVRRHLQHVQRALREHGPLVAEGRDLGTVVFADAEVKIFLDADLEVRARRRARELEGRGIALPIDQVRAELAARDERDRERAESPLRPAPDAVRVDGTGRDLEHVVAEVLAVVGRHPGYAAVRAAPPAAAPAGEGGTRGPGRPRRPGGSGGPRAD